MEGIERDKLWGETLTPTCIGRMPMILDAELSKIVKTDSDSEPINKSLAADPSSLDRTDPLSFSHFGREFMNTPPWTQDLTY